MPCGDHQRPPGLTVAARVGHPAMPAWAVATARLQSHHEQCQPDVRGACRVCPKGAAAHACEAARLTLRPSGPGGGALATTVAMTPDLRPAAGIRRRACPVQVIPLARTGTPSQPPSPSIRIPFHPTKARNRQLRTREDRIASPRQGPRLWLAVMAAAGPRRPSRRRRAPCSRAASRQDGPVPRERSSRESRW